MKEVRGKDKGYDYVGYQWRIQDFPWGGGHQPRCGVLSIILAIFPDKCKKNWIHQWLSFCNVIFFWKTFFILVGHLN